MKLGKLQKANCLLWFWLGNVFVTVDNRNVEYRRIEV